MTEIAGAIHFLRPWWLLAVPLVWLLWRRLRALDVAPPPFPANIAPHLAEHLLVNRGGRYRIRAVDLLAAGTLLLALAAAGPSRRLPPDPRFADSQPPLVIALNVAESMLAGDVEPSRLLRAKHEVLDLLALRRGSRVALIAYAGSAHLVLPFTDDPTLMKPFVDALTPEVMPVAGRNASAAAALASTVLARTGTRGTILFVTDGIDEVDIAAFERQRREGGPGTVALIVGNEDRAARRTSDAGGREREGARSAALRRWQRVGDVEIVREEAGDGDLRALERAIAIAATRAGAGSASWNGWNDGGWLLAWPAALLLLVCFRRGWTLAGWPSALALLALAQPPNAVADPWEAWVTPDQRGRLAYERRDYAGAAGHFQDPMWKGVALYRQGRYPEAVQAFARVPGPDGLFNLANALLKDRRYAEARAAYQRVLALAPEHAGARRNLPIAIAILARLGELRGEEDAAGALPGEEPTAVDEGANEGGEVVVDERTMLGLEASEQWMRLVETRVADFLRSRFALEAARESAR